MSRKSPISLENFNWSKAERKQAYSCLAQKENYTKYTKYVIRAEEYAFWNNIYDTKKRITLNSFFIFNRSVE